MKRIAKGSFNYSIARLLTSAIGFLLIPIYTRFLLPSDYGIISIITSLTGVLTVIYGMGLTASWFRFYYDYKDNPDELKEYFGTIAIFLFSVIFIVTVILSLCGKNIFNSIIKDVPFEPYVQIALWTTFLGLFFPLWIKLFQIREQSKKYGLVSIANFIVRLVSVIFFVVILKQGGLGKIKGDFYAVLIFFMIALFGLRKEIKLKFNIQKLKLSLLYGLPLIPHSLAGWIINLSDRLVLGHFKPLATVGIYNIGYMVGSIISLIVGSINYAYAPIYMATLKEKKDEAKTIISRLTTYYAMLILFFVLCISIFAKEVITIMTVKSYYESYKIVPIIALSYFLNGMYFMVVGPIFYIKSATKYLPIATLSSAGINLLLNYLLIPKYGMMGAAVATLISFVICLLGTWFIANRIYPIRFEYKRIGLIFLGGGIILILGLFVNSVDLRIWQGFIIKLILIFLYPMILLLFGVLKWSEIRTIKNSLSNKSK